MDRVTLVSSLQSGDEKTFCQQTHLNAVIQHAKNYSESYCTDVTPQCFGVIQYTGLPTELNLSQCPKPKHDTYIFGEYNGLTTLVGVFRSSGAFDRCCTTQTSNFCTVECVGDFEKKYKADIKNCPKYCSYCEETKTGCDTCRNGCTIVTNNYCTYLWNYGVLRGYRCYTHGGSDPEITKCAVYCFFQYKVKTGTQQADVSNAPISIYQKYLV